MSTSNNRSVLEEARVRFNSGDVNGYLETLYAPDVRFHFFPPELPAGLEGARLFYAGFMSAFPDTQFTPEDIVEQGDRMAVRYRLDMTHLGEFQGVPATGGRVRLNGITFLRFEDGKVRERWNEGDFIGLMQQLGALPAPESV